MDEETLGRIGMVADIPAGQDEMLDELIALARKLRYRELRHRTYSIWRERIVTPNKVLA